MPHFRQYLTKKPDCIKLKYTGTAMPAGRFHIIIGASRCPHQTLSNQQGLKRFLVSITNAIGMHILKGPIIAKGRPENLGLSGFVIIDYSHISVHTFTKFNQALIDIFSCKPYNREKAIQEVLRYFQIPITAAAVQQISWS